MDMEIKTLKLQVYNYLLIVFILFYFAVSKNTECNVTMLKASYFRGVPFFMMRSVKLINYRGLYKKKNYRGLYKKKIIY